ncbi:hypothetical protein OFB78_29825, partial [Escherichia coli]|nr:hypothetical protein [Escherichia coli]
MAVLATGHSEQCVESEAPVKVPTQANTHNSFNNIATTNFQINHLEPTPPASNSAEIHESIETFHNPQTI